MPYCAYTREEIRLKRERQHKRGGTKEGELEKRKKKREGLKDGEKEKEEEEE